VEKVRRNYSTTFATFNRSFLFFLGLRRRHTKKLKCSWAIEVRSYALVRAYPSQGSDVRIGRMLVLKFFTKEVSVHQSEPVALEPELCAADDESVDGAVRRNDIRYAVALVFGLDEWKVEARSVVRDEDESPPHRDAGRPLPESFPNAPPRVALCDIFVVDAMHTRARRGDWDSWLNKLREGIAVFE
jgi:hypothetical protein